MLNNNNPRTQDHILLTTAYAKATLELWLDSHPGSMTAFTERAIVEKIEREYRKEHRSKKATKAQT